jgi:MoxR-like ATPase
MAQVNLNIDDLRGFMGHIINNNRFLQGQGKLPVAIEVLGESGIGKTSTVKQIAEEHDLDFVKLNLAQIEELGDLVGFPVREFQMYKEKVVSINNNKDSVAYGAKTAASKDVAQLASNTSVTKKIGQWVSELAVSDYLSNGYKMTGKNRMSYAAPEWISDKKKGGILLLDDWNRADVRFIQAVMELIDRQTYISWSLPQDWHIVLTANPDNGDYMVNSIDAAQKTRYITANLQFDVNVWARWAEEEGIDTRCINFMLLHPELVTQETNARAITTFFNSISSFESFEDNLSYIQMIGEGSVGEEFASMFTVFINNKLDKLVTPKDLLTHDNEQYILGELTGCIGKDDNYRADIASTLATRLANFAVVYSKDNTISQKITDRLETLCTKEYFTNDLKYLVVRTIFNGNKQKFNKLMMKPEIIKMTVK